MGILYSSQVNTENEPSEWGTSRLNTHEERASKLWDISMETLKIQKQREQRQTTTAVKLDTQGLWDNYERLTCK